MKAFVLCSILLLAAGFTWPSVHFFYQPTPSAPALPTSNALPTYALQVVTNIAPGQVIQASDIAKERSIIWTTGPNDFALDPAKVVGRRARKLLTGRIRMSDLQ